MQTRFKSLLSLAFGQTRQVSDIQRSVGAPQPLPTHLHQFVAGGTAAPKRGWDIEAPKRGW